MNCQYMFSLLIFFFLFPYIAIFSPPLTCFPDGDLHSKVKKVRVSVFHLELRQDGLNQLTAGGAVGDADGFVFHLLHEAPHPHPHRRLE